MPDEPTLRDRIALLLHERAHGVGVLWEEATDGERSDAFDAADAVLAVVAPELERRDERIAELEIDLSNQIKVGLACGKVHARVKAERDEARAEVERLRRQVTELDAASWRLRDVLAWYANEANVQEDGGAYGHGHVTLDGRLEWDRGRRARAAASAASGNTETGTEETDG